MNDRCGCVRAHGYDLTGKMTGGGLHSVAWASAITLDSTSVIALAAKHCGRAERAFCPPAPSARPHCERERESAGASERASE